MSVSVEVKDGKVLVESPYNPDFPAQARQLGGKWSDPSWVFDARDEERVRELCLEIYGTDGTVAAGDLVTIRVRLGEQWCADKQALYCAGRQVAYARGRDSGARLGDGVVVLNGGFSSGGSAKNWMTIGKEGTVFELRDVPRPAVEKAIAEVADSDDITIEIVGEAVVNREALEAEREALLARLAVIDALLDK